MAQEETKRDEVREDDREFIYIPDEDGNEEEFEVIMYFDVDELGKRYIIVAPTETEDGDEDEDTFYAFSYEEDGEELKLYPITDEKEWDIVIETYNTIVSEMEEEGRES